MPAILLLCSMISYDAECRRWAIGGLNVMIWGMDLWVFTAFILTYIAVIFSLIYGLWPRKEEEEEGLDEEV
jgi:hypothetical protein